MPTEIKIKKAKIVKDKTLELSYVKTEDDKSVTKVNEEHNAEVHRDLKKAFSGLDVHLAIIFEFVKAATITDIDEVDAEVVNDFHVTSYSIGGDEGDEGITITGTKKLASGKAFNFNTPFTRFTTTEEHGYKFVDDLLKKVGIIEGEVVAYLNEGKKADDNQGKLFDDNGAPITHMQIAEPMTDQEKFNEKMKGASSYANPEAMERVAGMDGEDKAGEEDPIGGAIGAMVQEQREILQGKKGRGRKKTA